MAAEFNWIQWLATLLSSLVGGGAVFFLNEHAARRRTRLDSTRRLYDAKIELYAEWITAMETLMQSWTTPKPTFGKGVRAGLLLRKLELLESDAHARRLLAEIPKTLPAEGTKDHQDMALGIHFNPDFDWEPFRSKVNELMDRVRASRPD
jgi:hypothetical protein